MPSNQNTLPLPDGTQATLILAFLRAMWEQAQSAAAAGALEYDSWQNAGTLEYDSWRDAV